MSKKAIDDLLDNLINHIKENKEYRKVSDTKEHLYEVSAADIAKQLKYQLAVLIKTIPNFNAEIIDTLAKEYSVNLYNAFNKEVLRDDNRRRVAFSFDNGSIPTDFTVRISQKGTATTNVFRAINKIRTEGGENTPLNILRSQIIKKLFNSNTSNNIMDIVYGSRKKTNDGFLKDASGKEVRSGGLLQLGHLESSSIAEKRVILSLDHLEKSLDGFSNVKSRTPGSGITKPNSTLTLKAAVRSFIRKEDLKHIEVSIEYTRVKDESAIANTSKGSSEEKALIKNLAKTLGDQLRAIDWINQKGSRSPKEIIISELINASLNGDKKAKVKAKFPNAKAKNNKDKYVSKPKVLKTTKEVTKSKETLGNALNVKGAVTKSRGVDKKSSSSQNWSSVIAIINTKLADRIKDNMIAPRLVNRTGRFAESAKVMGVESTAQGYPSFVFDYQRNPYEVFDRVNGRSPWNTPNRDPKSLIALSVRQIAQELAIGRFYTRRA